MRDPQLPRDEVHVELDGAHAQVHLVGQRKDLVVRAQRRVGLNPPHPREEGAEGRVEGAVAVREGHRRVVRAGERGEAEGQPRGEALLRVQGVGEPGGDPDATAGADADGAPEDGPGELRLAGPALFAGYWGKPEATAESFDEQGFFRTGDTVVRQGGVWCILGRTSVDIIKCGGYKLSALEIEAHLLEHPAIAEAAVVGLPDEAYGQVVGAVLAGKAGTAPPTLAELRVWARDIMAPYKVPTVVRALDAIPRNAMGKTNKKELAKLFEEAPQQ